MAGVSPHPQHSNCVEVAQPLPGPRSFCLTLRVTTALCFSFCAQKYGRICVHRQGHRSQHVRYQGRGAQVHPLGQSARTARTWPHSAGPAWIIAKRIASLTHWHDVLVRFLLLSRCTSRQWSPRWQKTPTLLCRRRCSSNSMGCWTRCVAKFCATPRPSCSPLPLEPMFAATPSSRRAST